MVHPFVEILSVSILTCPGVYSQRQVTRTRASGGRCPVSAESGDS